MNCPSSPGTSIGVATITRKCQYAGHEGKCDAMARMEIEAFVWDMKVLHSSVCDNNAVDPDKHQLSRRSRRRTQS